MNIEDEARQEAERRWPHTGDTTVDIRRSALRHTFVKGVKWASEQADREPSDAARRLADVVEYTERIAGSNRAESPFAVERVRHHDALSILRIARGETNEGEGNEHSG